MNQGFQRFNHAILSSFVKATFTLSMMAPTAFAAADEIQYIAEPQQALSAFTKVIEGAKSSIEIANFIFEPCHPSTQIIMQRLVKKARQGVHVRLVIDAFSQSDEQKEQLAAYFLAKGIEFKLFNDNFFETNFRMHAKYMIVDRHVLLAGGRNLADQYFALSTTLNYVDRDILARGSMGEQAARAFDKLWKSEQVYDVTPASSVQPWSTFCGADTAPRRAEIEKFLTAHADSILKNIPVRTCENAHFWVDDSDFDNPEWGPQWDDGRGAGRFLTSARLKRKHSTRQTLKFIAGAQKTLSLENESYLPITALGQVFRKARASGVHISVLSNEDMDEGPQFFRDIIEYEYAKFAAQDSVKPEWVGLVSSLGVLNTNFELTPPGVHSFIHGKVAVRDNKDALVGSFNLDGRSENINVETAMYFPNCPALVDDIKKGMSQVRHSYDVDKASGQIPKKDSPTLFTIILGDSLLPQL
jgi:cardiolipin synthase C